VSLLRAIDRCRCISTRLRGASAAAHSFIVASSRYDAPRTIGTEKGESRLCSSRPCEARVRGRQWMRSGQRVDRKRGHGELRIASHLIVHRRVNRSPIIRAFVIAARHTSAASGNRKHHVEYVRASTRYDTLRMRARWMHVVVWSRDARRLTYHPSLCFVLRRPAECALG
jgi:hypothetical protein